MQTPGHLEIGPASAPCEELGLLSLLEEDALMSLVYSQMFANLELDKPAEILKAAVKAAGEMARLQGQSESEARAKTMAEARAMTETAAAGMLRAAARVRAAAEESAKAQAQVEAAEVARMGAETQRAEEQRATTAATARAQAATEAEQAKEVRLVAEEVAEEARAEVEAEARAEFLTRKFADEAAKATDEALGLTRKYATSEQRLWLDRALLACQSQVACQSPPTTDEARRSDTDRVSVSPMSVMTRYRVVVGDTDDTDDYSKSSADFERHRYRLSGRRHPPLTLTAAEGASPAFIRGYTRLRATVCERPLGSTPQALRRARCSREAMPLPEPC